MRIDSRRGSASARLARSEGGFAPGPSRSPPPSTDARRGPDAQPQSTATTVAASTARIDRGSVATSEKRMAATLPEAAHVLRTRVGHRPRSADAGRPGSAAVDAAELDAAVERIAQVVGAEADDDLARADAFGADPRRELAVLTLEVLLDRRRAFLREHLVGLRIAGAAGMPDDLQAGVA